MEWYEGKESGFSSAAGLENLRRVEKMEMAPRRVPQSSDSILIPLAHRVLSLIESDGALTAKEIAERLGVEKSAVNSALYGDLTGRVQQDKGYRWSLPERSPTATRRATAAPSVLLARICDYYLACLAQDDLGGVSLWLTSSFDLDYAEISELPGGKTDFLSADGVQELLRKKQQSRKPLELHLGYPVRIRSGVSRAGRPYYRLEPLLVLTFSESEEARVGPPVLSDDPPQLNLEALRSLASGGGQAVMEETLALSESLGMAEAPTEVDLEEVALRLRALRPEWDWAEPIDGSSLSDGAPLHTLRDQGIYNRAIVALTERSPYTRGLETELGELRKCAPTQVRNTALDLWLDDPQSAPAAPDAAPAALLETLPLNTEQREAVQRALTEPLTVITGPPGTGKSQVVSAILQNAAWSGQSVLFASKNHKAVDVVQTRVNALSPRPVLLRLGQEDNQERLAEYLTSLLGSRPGPNEAARFDTAMADYERIRLSISRAQERTGRVVDLRNMTDSLEQKAEQAREVLGAPTFAASSELELGALEDLLEELRGAVVRADRSLAPFVVALVWFLLRKSREEELDRLQPAVRAALGSLGAEEDSWTAPYDLGGWRDSEAELTRRIHALRVARVYRKSLADLQAMPSLEALHVELREATRELSQVSCALWESWLRMQPERLDSSQRRVLGEYVAILRTMTGGARSGRGARQRYQKYFASFSKVSRLLPCWGITSLSARGRLPLEPGFFDLLVVDEASQCDIASALPLLYRARRAVVIGDPRQLRHITKLSAWQDETLLEKHEVPSRLSYASMSLFDAAASVTGSHRDVVQLRDHHRSHADIIGFSNQHFYQGCLRVATRYDLLKRPLGHTAIRWVDVQGPVQRPGGGGALNPAEAEAVVSELRRLLVQQGYSGTMGVVAPFRAQANRIRDLVTRDADLRERAVGADLLIDTVHRFQGDERDVMVFSPTISQGASNGALGFLGANPHLFNVALTRARAALVVVGDKGAARQSGVAYLRSFSEYVDRLNSGPVSQDTGARAPTLGPEYPPVSRPELVSEWEKVLFRALSTAGIPTIPQYDEERFIIDFAVIDGSRRLALEVDGERYHRSWDGELTRRDQLRNLRLLELGWDLLRFWVYEVRDDLDSCVRRVQGWLDGVRDAPV